MMTSIEKRRHERQNIKSESLQGEFFLQVDGENYDLLNVNNVSVSGMGTAFLRQVAPQTPIKVVYEAPDIQIVLPGQVVWCRPCGTLKGDAAEHLAFRIGIEFDQHNMTHNTLLFMAMRKYLDTFS